MANSQSPSEPLESWHVVMALPDPVRRDAIAAELRAQGCTVRLEADPAGALLALTDRPADVVIAPLTGQRIAGGTLGKLLRGWFGPDGPLLVLVGEVGADPALVERAAAASDDVLLAPTPDRVWVRLDVLLRLRAAGRASHDTHTIAVDSAFTPPCTFGDFDLLAVLGSGNHGVVYEARRRSDGAEVALKLLGRQAGEQRELLGRFLREVHALAEVRSRHVVRVLGAGCERGRWFLAMERVRGQPASALAGRLEARTAMRVARGVCKALVALDAQGLVHRDVKPANIVVDDLGQATLVDFGLAKRPEDTNLTSKMMIVGSPHYLAAETINEGTQDMGSDLYALGVTLWELLVGSRPFDARTPRELLELIASGSPAPDVRKLRRQVPASVAWLIGRLLEPDAARRLNDPRAALEEIERVSRMLGSQLDFPALV